MNNGEWYAVWLIGLTVVGVWAGMSFFSRRGSRTARRRRKSHGRVISKTHKPSVRFSVRPPKE